MRLDEYAAHDGLGLAELLRNGEVTARELGELALAGIAKVNPRLNAVIETFPERLVGLSKTQTPKGPFGGVPIRQQALEPNIFSTPLLPSHA